MSDNLRVLGNGPLFFKEDIHRVIRKEHNYARVHIYVDIYLISSDHYHQWLSLYHFVL